MSALNTKGEVDVYLDRLYAKTVDDGLNEPKVRLSITEMIVEACKITGLETAKLLSGLDFKPNDLTIEALEAFLAELRAIFWLRDFHFTSIVPLQALNNSAQPDFTANHDGRTCAIEVFCLTNKHEQQKDPKLGIYKNFDPTFEGSKFGRDFKSKANDKKKQLDSKVADLRVLLCVINSQPVIRLNTKEQMETHAEFLYKELSWGKNYYLGLLTGVSSDVVFPNL